MKTCVSCGCQFERPAGMWTSKWRMRRTCGKPECRLALTRAASAEGLARKSLDAAAAHVEAPYPRQIRYARFQATADELRLISPAIRAAAGVW